MDLRTHSPYFGLRYEVSGLPQFRTQLPLTMMLALQTNGISPTITSFETRTRPEDIPGVEKEKGILLDQAALHAVSGNWDDRGPVQKAFGSAIESIQEGLKVSGKAPETIKLDFTV